MEISFCASRANPFCRRLRKEANIDSIRIRVPRVSTTPKTDWGGLHAQTASNVENVLIMITTESDLLMHCQSLTRHSTPRLGIVKLNCSRLTEKVLVVFLPCKLAGDFLQFWKRGKQWALQPLDDGTPVSHALDLKQTISPWKECVCRDASSLPLFEKGSPARFVESPEGTRVNFSLYCSAKINKFERREGEVNLPRAEEQL